MSASVNERTNSPFNMLEVRIDIVLLVVLWRVRYKLSLRDQVEMFRECGFEFMQGAVRELEARFAPLVVDKLRPKRKGQTGRSRHTDPTYIKVGGAWKYLYPVTYRDGNLVDSMVREYRDMDADKRFFNGALELAEQGLEKVTTDGDASYPCAIREMLGEDAIHRCNPYLTNRIEQDHRGVKQRYYPLRGRENFDSTSRFRRAFDEQCHYFRVRTTMRQHLPPLSERRRVLRSCGRR